MMSEVTETYEHLDPATLVVAENVRIDPRLDRELINSIKARLSVLQSEEARLDPSVKVEPAPAPVARQIRNASLEALFMEEAKATLAPEVYHSLLVVARERHQSLNTNDNGNDRERQHRHGCHRHGRRHDRRNGYQNRGRNGRHR